ncbi:aspartic proteinase nepenthesin-2 [Morus notabilis]|uniref:aspartic proteinase nepenthesin-2 n=1 Tax=Morus notabilis TaxID=981085 RepID=UPI000CED7692|nr:aspartic proteinase nepenthesin-2 [Morus notabilis]
MELPPSPAFDPDKSVSSKPLHCYSSAGKCAWIHGKNSNCRYASLCPGYEFMFASWTTDGFTFGSTFGHLITETMENNIPDFLIGCSNSPSRLPLGYAAFGNANQSLPSQMALKKFSFHDGVSYPDLTYTPLFDVAVELGPHFRGYYYLKLQEIVVGDKRIAIPVEKQLPKRDGNGGTIVDTGIPFTFLERSIYEAVRHEFENHMGNFSRAPDHGVLGTCFSSTSCQDITMVPVLSFVFDGVAKMDFPTQKYFLIDDKVGAVCLSLTTDVVGGVGPNVGLSSGPAVLLGNYLLMDSFMEFDLVNSRLGLQQEHCDI